MVNTQPSNIPNKIKKEVPWSDGKISIEWTAKDGVVVRDNEANVEIYRGESVDEADRAARDYMNSEKDRTKEYYLKHFGFDPDEVVTFDGSVIVGQTGYYNADAKCEQYHGYEHFFLPEQDPTLVKAGLEIGARVFEDKNGRIYNRMVFRLRSGSGYSKQYYDGDHPDKRAQYYASRYLSETTLRRRQIVRVLMKQLDLPAKAAMDALIQAELHPIQAYREGKVRKIPEYNGKEESVDCVHTAVYDTTLKGFEGLDDIDLARKVVQTPPANGMQLVDLPLVEHFASLKMYVGGIVELGLNNCFTQSYHSEEINPTTMTFGFNSFMQNQILKCLGRILPREVIRNWTIDLITEIIDSVPRSWLESRWDKLWFHSYETSEKIVLEKYPYFRPILVERIYNLTSKKRLNTIPGVALNQILEILDQYLEKGDANE